MNVIFKSLPPFRKGKGAPPTATEKLRTTKETSVPTGGEERHPPPGRKQAALQRRTWQCVRRSAGGRNHKTSREIGNVHWR